MVVLREPDHLTLIFNLQRAVVMTHAHAKYKGQKSKVRQRKTDRWTWSDHLTIPANTVQGGPKNGLFFRLDNFVTVSPSKACSMSKFSQFYRKKGTKLAFQ